MGPTTRSLVLRSLGFLFVLEAMLVPAILFWPNFQGNIDALRSMAPLPMLKDMIDALGKGGIAAYVLGQHFFKGCNSLGVAAAILFSMGAVAGEAQRGTLEIWLSRPLSRRRMLTEKWIGGALAISLPVFLSSATIPWLISFVDESMQLGPLMLCALHQSLFLVMLYSVTFLLSCIGRKPTVIAFVMLFFTTLEFALYLVKTATHTSLFRLVDVPTFLAIHGKHALAADKIAIMACVTLITYLASLWIFARRVP
jgi:hypothetical protein